MSDPMMSKDIEDTLKAYDIKKQPILEVSQKIIQNIVFWKSLKFIYGELYWKRFLFENNIEENVPNKIILKI